MITSAKYINFLVEHINVLRQEIISKSKIGIIENNIHLENFVGELLNQVYGYELKNLNEEKKNYPGIDLGDFKSSIGFQVTSTKTGQKIKESLQKISKNKCYIKFNNIKFFILTERQKIYSTKLEYDKEINFNSQTDIIDFDSLYLKAMYLGIDEQKKVVEYVHKQIPYVTQSIGVDYFNPITSKRLLHSFEQGSWKEGEIIIEHNFGYLPQVSVMDDVGSEVTVHVKRDETKVTLSANPSFQGKALLT